MRASKRTHTGLHVWHTRQRTMSCTLHVPIRHSFKRATRARARFAVNLIHTQQHNTHTRTHTQFDELNITHAFPCVRARVYIWWMVARVRANPTGLVAHATHATHIIASARQPGWLSATQLAARDPRSSSKTIVGRVIERTRCGHL